MSLSAAVRTLFHVTVKSSLFHCHSSSVVLCAPLTHVLHLRLPPTPTVLKRYQCDTSPDATAEAERRLISKLQETFPKAAEIRVQYISGGCGSMFEVHVLAEEFRNVRTVVQHRMVNEALKDEIKNMHGLRISTSAPESWVHDPPTQSVATASLTEKLVKTWCVCLSVDSCARVDFVNG